jgi:nucleoid-associated protein YgaU
MSSLLDRLLGREKKEPEKKETSSKVSDEAARKRREELAQERKEAEEARKRFEQQEALRKSREAVQKAHEASKAKREGWEKVVQTGTGVAAEVKQVYVVKSGDSLSKIAKELLGDASRWPEIYELNKDVIGDNPNLIKPGQEFKIPK